MVTTLQRISAAEAAARAARIRLVVCDNDGVLTDGTVFVSARGEELKQYSLRDGMGVERLREVGVAVGILTRESTGFVPRRAEKLKLPHVWIGVRDKRAHLGTILEEARVSIDELAYMGDDVNDLEIIESIGEAGLTAAPADAMSEVRERVHLITGSVGGRGAFRELAEWVLRHRTR